MQRFLTQMAMAATSNVTKITKISVDPTILPSGAGLSIEQPAWDPKTERFYTSVPIIANNPPGCNYGQLSGPITCDGGLLVTDPFALTTPTATQGAFDSATNTGVVPLHACGPNGATVGPHDNLLLGCNPGNNPSNTTTLVINAKTKNYANIGNITGADEVWFNSGDRRYYLGASKMIGLLPDCGPAGSGARRHRWDQRVDRNHPAISPIRTRLRPTPSVIAFSFRKLRLSRWLGPVATLRPLARGSVAA